MASNGQSTESTIALVASAVVGGMESLYLATRSTVVTVVGAVLIAVLVLRRIGR